MNKYGFFKENGVWKYRVPKGILKKRRKKMDKDKCKQIDFEPIKQSEAIQPLESMIELGDEDE